MGGLREKGARLLRGRWRRRGDQDRPKTTQDRPKTAQDRPKIAPNRPKTPQDRPETTPKPPQDHPRQSQDRPRPSKTDPRTTVPHVGASFPCRLAFPHVNAAEHAPKPEQLKTESAVRVRKRKPMDDCSDSRSILAFFSLSSISSFSSRPLCSLRCLRCFYRFRLLLLFCSAFSVSYFLFSFSSLSPLLTDSPAYPAFIGVTVSVQFLLLLFSLLALRPFSTFTLYRFCRLFGLYCFYLPKTPPNSPKTPPGRPKTVPRPPQDNQHCPKSGEECLKCRQDRPKSGQDCKAKSHPRAAKSNPRPPKTTQERPRASQERPKSSQDHPKSGQGRPTSKNVEFTLALQLFCTPLLLPPM